MSGFKERPIDLPDFDDGNYEDYRAEQADRKRDAEIADAVEKMASSYDPMREEKGKWKRRIAALEGYVTRLKSGKR